MALVNLLCQLTLMHFVTFNPFRNFECIFFNFECIFLNLNASYLIITRVFFNVSRCDDCSSSPGGFEFLSFCLSVLLVNKVFKNDFFIVSFYSPAATSGELHVKRDAQEMAFTLIPKRQTAL